MTAQRGSLSRSSARRATGILRCPACGNTLKADAKWCPTCNFTGGDSLAMFPGAAPPLLPISDPLGLLNASGLRKISQTRDKLIRRFPQLQWRISIDRLAIDTPLPLLGFWLLNASPLHGDETVEQRAWTVLLVINAEHGKVAVAAGYAAETCISDDEWKTVLSTMAAPWAAGNPSAAICQFFDTTRRHLERNWIRFGNHAMNQRQP
jgi:hypothetical protein